jgi:hypothetical protein
MQLTVRQQNENENVSQAPTLGGFGGVVTGQAGGQKGRGAVSGRGSGFTNLQSYIRANESNPNAQLIQQRTGQATEAQRQAQTGFETQAGQARSQLQGIQEQAGVVRSALNDPTKFVLTPENIKRITELRTGKEAIANPTAIQQNVLQGAQGLQSQRGQLASALQRDVTGTGLQEYLRSQRVNPALATAGENRLDRFLAEQTTSGQQAIGGAMTEAERIALLNQPEQVGQIGQLVSQVQGDPYSSTEAIQKELSARQQAGEKQLTGLDRQYVGGKVGIRNLGQAEQSYNQYNAIQNQMQAVRNDINEILRQRSIAMAAKKREEDAINNNPNDAVVASRARFNIIQHDNTIRDANAKIQSQDKNFANLVEQSNSLQAEANLYSQFLSQMQKPREQLLQEYDPTALARLKALQQITGSSFEQLLGGKIV